jgi:hypothetical protein
LFVWSSSISCSSQALLWFCCWVGMGLRWLAVSGRRAVGGGIVSFRILTTIYILKFKNSGLRVYIWEVLALAGIFSYISLHHPQKITLLTEGLGVGCMLHFNVCSAVILILTLQRLFSCHSYTYTSTFVQPFFFSTLERSFPGCIPVYAI